MRVAVALAVSLGACVAIWWFHRHGWPFAPSGKMRSRLEVGLFMLAPCGILVAIISALGKDLDEGADKNPDGSGDPER